MAGAGSGRSKWTLIILMIATPAPAVDRARLDRCQAQLGACYERCCKSRATPKACNEKCTTDQCGLHWKETYGAFVDRRIEENASRRTRKKFIGLNRMKGQRRNRPRFEEPRPAEDFLSFFGLD